MLEHVGVVANLSQLHDSVHQGLRATFTLENLEGKKNLFICNNSFNFEITLIVLYFKCLQIRFHQYNKKNNNKTFLTFLSFSEPSVSKTPLACMCLYKTLCRADMSHFMTYSTYTEIRRNPHKLYQLFDFKNVHVCVKTDC